MTMNEQNEYVWERKMMRNALDILSIFMSGNGRTFWTVMIKHINIRLHISFNIFSDESSMFAEHTEQQQQNKIIETTLCFVCRRTETIKKKLRMYKFEKSDLILYIV